MAITLIQPFNLDTTKDYTFANTTATGNTTANNLTASNIVSAGGNITGANILTLGVVSATANITTANYFIGNGAFLTGITTGVQDKIANGNSNVYIPTSNGNVTITAVGNANIVVITGTGANINGYLTVSGNIQSGNANLGNAASANFFIGSGNNLSNIQVANVSGLGNIATVNLDGNSGNILYGNGVFAAAASPYGNSNVASFLASYGSNTITTTGNVTVGNIIGNGQALTGLAGANVTGTVANANYAAYAGNVTIAGQSNITSLGTLTGLSATGNANIADLNVSGNAVITGNLTVSGTTEYINVTNLAVKDPIISIGRGDNNAPLTTDDGKDRGEQLWYYSGSEKSAFIGYDNSAGKIIAAKDVSISSEVVTVNTYGNFVVGDLEANTVSTVGNIDTANNVSAAGNVNANNINVGNIISATGNVAGNYILGNGAFLTGIAVGVQDKIANGNSNVYIPTANGNVTITTAGNANVVVITGTGANITGYANITGNITSAGSLSITGNINGNVITGNGSGLTNLAGANISGQVANALVAGTVYTASQPNITSVGTLTSLTVGPNSSIILSGNTGYVRANSIQGRDGSQAIYPYFGNVSGAVGIVADLTVGVGGSGNLTVANGNVAFSGANVGLGNVSNLHIDGGTLNYFLKTDGSGNLSWALPSASPGGTTPELQFNDTGVFQGTANLEFDSTEYRLSIQNYSLVVQALGGVSGATTINVTNGCYVTATSAGITTWIFTFPAPSANASGFVIELTNGGTYTQNWPLAVRWPGGSAPELTATGVDVLVFITNDNGTTWRGALSMLNST